VTEHRSERRLAGILSADVVGYSRLMAADEQATIDTITSCRDEIAGRVRDHRGRVVDAPGDNVLAEFPTALDAMRCAIEVQRALAERNQTLPEDRRMRFRIGVHLGEVSVREGRLYGDGINIAARLEALAEPGGICVSGTAYDVAHSGVDAGFQNLGEQAIKNLPDPVRVYRVLTEGVAGTMGREWPRWLLPALAATALAALLAGGLWLYRPAGGGAGSSPSIAVLPFTNLSGDPEQDYFSDGLTEDIITGLSQFQNLFVLARNTTFQYKGQAVDIVQVGRDLGVGYVLEGSVRREADTIRVTAQLLDAGSGAHLWAESYDRDLTADDVFGVQDDIKNRVVSTIASSHGVISRADQARLRERGTDNLSAYECLLRSYEYEHLHTAESHLRARTCLEQAVELDPGYVEARAQLAYLYREEYQHGFNPLPGSLDRALETARHAIRLDATNQQAYYALALTYFGRKEYDSFFVAAERAIELNPNNARVLGGLGIHIAYAGQWERGVALCEKALALNPARPWWIHLPASLDHYRKVEYEQALAQAQKISVLSHTLVHVALAASYGQLGRPAEGRAALDDLAELGLRSPDQVADELRRFLASEELVLHLLEGLHKAGLEQPDELARRPLSG